MRWMDSQRRRLPPTNRRRKGHRGVKMPAATTRSSRHACADQFGDVGRSAGMLVESDTGAELGGEQVAIGEEGDHSPVLGNRTRVPPPGLDGLHGGRGVAVSVRSRVGRNHRDQLVTRNPSGAEAQTARLREESQAASRGGSTSGRINRSRRSWRMRAPGSVESEEGGGRLSTGPIVAQRAADQVSAAAQAEAAQIVAAAREQAEQYRRGRRGASRRSETRGGTQSPTRGRVSTRRPKRPPRTSPAPGSMRAQKAASRGGGEIAGRPAGEIRSGVAAAQRKRWPGSPTDCGVAGRCAVAVGASFETTDDHPPPRRKPSRRRRLKEDRKATSSFSDRGRGGAAVLFVDRLSRGRTAPWRRAPGRTWAARDEKLQVGIPPSGAGRRRSAGRSGLKSSLPKATRCWRSSTARRSPWRRRCGSSATRCAPTGAVRKRSHCASAARWTRSGWQDRPPAPQKSAVYFTGPARWPTPPGGRALVGAAQRAG